MCENLDGNGAQMLQREAGTNWKRQKETEQTLRNKMHSCHQYVGTQACLFFFMLKSSSYKWRRILPALGSDIGAKSSLRAVMMQRSAALPSVMFAGPAWKPAPQPLAACLSVQTLFNYSHY